VGCCWAGACSPACGCACEPGLIGPGSGWPSLQTAAIRGSLEQYARISASGRSARLIRAELLPRAEMRVGAKPGHLGGIWAPAWEWGSVSLITVLHPDWVLLGGCLSGAATTFLRPLREVDGAGCCLKAAQAPDSALCAWAMGPAGWSGEKLALRSAWDEWALLFPEIHPDSVPMIRPEPTRRSCCNEASAVRQAAMALAQKTT